MSEARTKDEPQPSVVPLKELTDDQLRALVDGTFPAMDDDEPTATTVGAQEPTEEQKVVSDDSGIEAAPDNGDDDVPSELDLLKLRVERLQAAEDRAAHFQRAHDKLTGEYGRVNQELLRLKSRSMTDNLPDATDEAGYDRTESRASQAVLKRLEAMENWQREWRMSEANRALMEEAGEFRAKFPDAADYQQDMVPILSERQQLITEALETADPSRVRSIARDVMRDAYFTAKENRLRARMEEAEKRRTANRERLERQKVSAGVSATGGTRVATKQRPRSLKDLSDDELKELVDATGDTL